MGRPGKLTAATQARIVEAIAGGHTFKAACASAGIDYTTLRLWMVRGERGADGDGEYSAFFDAIRQAENTAIMRAVAIIRDAAPKHWQAAAWWLERRHPDEWGRRARLDIRVELEDEARRLAVELGIDEAVALEEARAILAEGRQSA